MVDTFADLMIELNNLLEEMKDVGFTKLEILKEIDNVFD